MGRYYNENNELAVIVHNSFGSPWAECSINPEISFDSRIVRYIIEHDYELDRSDMSKFLFEIGYDDIYIPMDLSLDITWIPKGTKFRIRNYDGCEWVETEDAIKWRTA